VSGGRVPAREGRLTERRPKEAVKEGVGWGGVWLR
jgi:hypothetical protein